MGDRETVTKPLTLPALLMLEEAEIKSLFPFGAVVNRKKRWRPAEKGEKADKGLKELLAEKKARQEQLRYPKAAYSQGNYTTVPALGLRGAGASVPESFQDRISEEGRERDELRRAATPLYEELKAIEGRLRPQQRAELRRRIEGFKRSVHDKAA